MGCSEHAACSGGVLRRLAARGRGYIVAQTLRSRLQRQDKAWDEKVPEDGVEDLGTAAFRRIASALDVKQGDRTKSALLKAIMDVHAERIDLVEGFWRNDCGSPSSDPESVHS